MDEEKTTTAPTLSDVHDDRDITGGDDDDMSFGSQRKRKPRRKKVYLDLKCPLCESGTKVVTYKDVYQLKKFTSVRGKIISTEKSGVCAKHQRQVSSAIKRARYMALLPYVAVDA